MVGDSTPLQILVKLALCCRKLQTHDIRSRTSCRPLFALPLFALYTLIVLDLAGRFKCRPNLFTIIAPSSMIHPCPITMGPAMAKIVALGWTTVPAFRTTLVTYETVFFFSLTGTDGYVTLEFHILTHNGLRVDCVLVFSRSFSAQGVADTHGSYIGGIAGRKMFPVFVSPLQMVT